MRLITVKTDPLEEAINQLGILEIGGQRYLKYPNNGIVEKVLVNVDDRINIGDELICDRPLEKPNQSSINREHFTFASSRLG